MTAVLARLRVTDPARWREVARSWRQWASLAGRLAAELASCLTRLGAAWSGAAGRAAVGRLAGLRRRLVLFRLLCWQADQAVSEIAAAVQRARALLARAQAAGLTVDDDGTARGTPPAGAAADLAAALAVAERADAAAAARLDRLVTLLRATAEAPGPERPDCAASPAAVRQWWTGRTPAERLWLLATEPGWIGPLDGIPAADRDAANRLLLDERRAELDRAITAAGRGERHRLRELRQALDALSDRLAGDTGPRAYLLRLDLADEGRTVVALGDPDRAANVLTHVPGMTADLASVGGELSRAERVAVRAAELGPSASSSAVLWLDYDAPDFVDEAASARQAEAAAPGLRRFQEGLRASHDGPAARQTVLGHSYGSLVVGKAAATPGLAADSVVFVGSPGVGVDSAAELRVPPGEVWASTSRSDIIQYAAVAPGSLPRDVAVAATVPLVGPWLAFGRPEDDLWFGHNPSDPGFGAHIFTSQPGGGHLGYWDRGRPALDALAAITLGTA
ncbi:MAG TPA: alpha/beta hydrolase [Actinoplanes sp.]